jgi:hypothetical protein
MSTPMTPDPQLPPVMDPPLMDPPVTEPMVTVSTHDSYAAATRAVDYLSDNGFPVGKVAIVGTDLRLVENVLGRLTVARAAGAGVLSGAWLGLFIGILLSIFTTSGWLGVLLAAIVIGAVWGGILGAAAHAMTGGRRDFTSTRRLEASQYAITVAADEADAARQLLTRQTWREANPS